MSMFKSVLFASLLAYTPANAAGGVLSKELGDEHTQSLRKFKQKFTVSGEYASKQETDLDPVKVQFAEFVQDYPEDYGLRYLYARFILPHNFDEGLNQLAYVVRFSNSGATDPVIRFTEELKKFGPKIASPIDSINLALLDPKEYAKMKKLTGGTLEKLNANITKALIQDSVDLLKSLESRPLCYEAMLQTIVLTMDKYGKSASSAQLVGWLYNEKNEKSSSLLKLYYALRCLMKEGKYQRAIEVYESILGEDIDFDNPYQTGTNYNNLAAAYRATSGLDMMKDLQDQDTLYKLRKAKTFLEKANFLEETPRGLANLAYIQIDLGEYDEGINNLKRVLSMPKNILEEARINLKEKKRALKVALQRAGRNEELAEILLKQQQRVFKKRTKIANLIKLTQAQQKKKSELAQRREQAPLEAPKKNDLSLKPVPLEGNSIDSQWTEYTPKTEEKETLSSVKVKKKTRKPSNRQPVEQPSLEQTEEEDNFIYVENLTQNRNAQKTFYKLFDRYTKQVGSDSNVQISLGEIENCLEALGQDFDSSKGHGSHKKVTLNFQNVGSDMEEQMIILTNKTYLKPEQIKDLRLGFVRARIVPDDPKIIEKLKKEGLVD